MLNQRSHQLHTLAITQRNCYRPIWTQQSNEGRRTGSFSKHGHIGAANISGFLNCCGKRPVSEVGEVSHSRAASMELLLQCKTGSLLLPGKLLEDELKGQASCHVKVLEAKKTQFVNVTGVARLVLRRRPDEQKASGLLIAVAKGQVAATESRGKFSEQAD